jgi:hypothetical protein
MSKRLSPSLERKYTGSLSRILTSSTQLTLTLRANGGTAKQLADSEIINEAALRLWRSLLNPNV